MMCPNKNHPDWKEMVEEYGKIEAFRHWLKGNYSVTEAKKSDQSKVAETPIKEGVSELFDSNSELANQVYEALIGTNVKIGNGRIDPNIGPDSHFYEILDNKNNIIGEIGVTYPTWVKEGDLPKASDFESNKVFISQVYLEDEFKGKGLGKEAYLKFLLSLQQRGFEISSGIKTSESASRVWESLVRDGYADKTADEYVFNNNFKQEALQLYSQYLDTIFPDSKVKDIVYHDTSHSKAIKNYKEYLQSKYDKKIDYINKETFGDPNYIEVFFKDGTSEILNEEESLKFVPFETFDKNLIGSIDGSVSGKGFYFYTNPEERYNRSRFFTLNALINVKNTADKSDSNLKDLFEEPSKSTDLLKKQGYDSVVGKLSTIGTEYVVFEPEQIHILGSKQDIEGFKEFVGEPKTEKKVDNTIFKPTPVEVQKQRPSTENVMREFTGRSIDEIFEQHKETLEQAGITLDQLKHSAAKNNLSNEEIEQWLQTCLGSSKKGSSNIRPPMAKQGMKSSKFTKGGTWRLVKDLQGYPTHEKGGVDLMIGKDGVSITSGQSNFKAEYGLILPYNVKDYV